MSQRQSVSRVTDTRQRDDTCAPAAILLDPDSRANYDAMGDEPAGEEPTHEEPAGEDGAEDVTAEHDQEDPIGDSRD